MEKEHKVYISNLVLGGRFHQNNCSVISEGKLKIKLQTAFDQGLKPCELCIFKRKNISIRKILLHSNNLDINDKDLVTCKKFEIDEFIRKDKKSISSSKKNEKFKLSFKKESKNVILKEYTNLHPLIFQKEKNMDYEMIENKIEKITNEYNWIDLITDKKFYSEGKYYYTLSTEININKNELKAGFCFTYCNNLNDEINNEAKEEKDYYSFNINQ